MSTVAQGLVIGAEPAWTDQPPSKRARDSGQNEVSQTKKKLVAK